MSTRPDPLSLYPTTAACPTWCARQHGHAYRYGLLDGLDTRYHRAHTRHLADLSAWAITLTVHQVEIADDSDGAGRRLLKPEVLLEAPHGLAELDPAEPAAQLRAIARRLLAAASALDEDLDLRCGPFGPEWERTEER